MEAVEPTFQSCNYGLYAHTALMFKPAEVRSSDFMGSWENKAIKNESLQLLRKQHGKSGGSGTYLQLCHYGLYAHAAIMLSLLR